MRMRAVAVDAEAVERRHAERGELGVAALYVLFSVTLSIGGLFAGLALVRNFS